MTTKEAVEHVLKSRALSKYRLAKMLDLASPSSINQYQRGTSMSAETAVKFHALFGITISDVHVR